MLKILLKKQIHEVWRSYFVNSKTNKPRSKATVILYFILFALLMLGVMGGMFTMLSVFLCEPLSSAGIGWLYFVLMSFISILFGAFGSVFNTFSSLYLSKDNDFLLSLPVPVKAIVASRLINVYLLGSMYSVIVILPALIVYYAVTGITAAKLVCGLMLILVISAIVMVLSCLLGWCVAKISLKLKNKSFVTVLASLLFIVLYYFFYFKATDLLTDLINNAQFYGEKIRGAAYGLYLFGRIGEGDFAAAGIFVAVSAALLIVTWLLLKSTFLSIATDSGKTAKVKYTEKRAKENSIFKALLIKEFRKFASNASYILNCGMGVIFIVTMGVFMLIKGSDIIEAFNSLFADSNYVYVMVCAALCMLSSMNNMAVPSVSLESKTLWMLQSLPVDSKLVLRAKMMLQLIISGCAMLFAVICTGIMLHADIASTLLVCVTPLVYTVFSAYFCTFLSIRMPNLHWTNEMTPIKQSGAVAISIFGGWALCAALGGGYFLFGYKIGMAAYLGCWIAVMAICSAVIARYLDTKGAQIFSELA